MANYDYTKDPAFLNMSPEDKHAFLLETDPGYKGMSPDDQRGFISSFNPPDPNSKPQSSPMAMVGEGEEAQGAGNLRMAKEHPVGLMSAGLMGLAPVTPPGLFAGLTGASTLIGQQADKGLHWPSMGELGTAAEHAGESYLAAKAPGVLFRSLKNWENPLTTLTRDIRSVPTPEAPEGALPKFMPKKVADWIPAHPDAASASVRVQAKLPSQNEVISKLKPWGNPPEAPEEYLGQRSISKPNVTAPAMKPGLIQGISSQPKPTSGFADVNVSPRPLGPVSAPLKPEAEGEGVPNLRRGSGVLQLPEPNQAPGSGVGNMAYSTDRDVLEQRALAGDPDAAAAIQKLKTTIYRSKPILGSK
jgi:hypothetical protein